MWKGGRNQKLVFRKQNFSSRCLELAASAIFLRYDNDRVFFVNKRKSWIFFWIFKFIFIFAKILKLKLPGFFLKLLYDFMDCVFATRITGKCNLPSTPHKNNFSNKLKSHRLFACLAQWCNVNFNQTNNLTLRWIFPFPYIVCTWERENFSSVFFLFCINQQCRHIMKSFALFS